MKKEREVKRAITHRMYLTSLEDVVESALAQLPRRLMDCGDEKVREGFRQWLAHLCDTLARHLEMDFQAAAKRGIEEAGKLISDPDYYETVKNRRRRERERYEASRKEQEETRERHERGDYTLEERLQRLGQAARYVKYYEQALEEARARLLHLQANPNEPWTPKPKTKTEGDEDMHIDWGDADF